MGFETLVIKLQQLHKRVWRFPMGFETKNSLRIYRGHVEFEDSLWDLKPAEAWEEGIERYLFEDSLWDLKREKEGVSFCWLPKFEDSLWDLKLVRHIMEKSGHLGFEDSLWDLKQAKEAIELAKQGFEDSLWDLKPSSCVRSYPAFFAVWRFPMGFETVCNCKDWCLWSLCLKIPYGIWNRS